MYLGPKSVLRHRYLGPKGSSIQFLGTLLGIHVTASENHVSLFGGPLSLEASIEQSSFAGKGKAADGLGFRVARAVGSKRLLILDRLC